MAETTPKAELDARYSDAHATATDWTTTRDRLADAPVAFLTTVRPDGRPHTTPLLTVWHDGALHFCTGPDERKAANLEANRHVVVTAGTDAYDGGLDVVVEGDAVRVTDAARLRALAAAWEAKYGADWHFDVADGAFTAEGRHALVFAIEPATVFGFAKGTFGQTRYRW
jgi:nitroimidazol reductase NimA-like FMN-containing flavoprotein (pyridoxamine 5'-phosphate oxidase superfamily)